MRIGGFSVTSLIDGEMRVAADFMYPEQDLSSPRGPARWIDPRSQDVIVSIGCYLIQDGARTILIDAGTGPWPKSPPVAGGAFRSALLAQGVEPGDVSHVIFTHLHFDHIGWATVDGVPFFPNAEYWCDRRDWDHFMSPHYDFEWERRLTDVDVDTARVRLAPLAGTMRFWAGSGEVIAGVTAMEGSGHTPGTTGLLLTSGEDRGLLLGDIAHTVPELIHGWRFRRHDDEKAALERIAHFREFLADEGIPVSGSHFPGLCWGRVVRTADGFDWREIGEA
jgi:glyoxylase-like metal-dependent hydrolase (beta-lactamase superfamily II)